MTDWLTDLFFLYQYCDFGFLPRRAGGEAEICREPAF